MPLPWKKTNISRLVADHIQSHKRLETGFPTSLVHLFVNNRDRLKKNKKKPSASDPAISPSLSPVINRNSCSTDSISESTYSRMCATVAADQIDMETVAGDSWSPDVRQNVSVNADAVIKMLVVLVLALGTKGFVIWITLSAFLLFFLEYVGKYLFRIYKSCSDSQIMLKLLVKKLPFQITERQTNSHKQEKPLIQSSEFSTSTAEIKNLEQPESNFLSSVEQSRTSKRENFTQLISLLEVMEMEDEMENISEVSQGKQQNRRRSKIAKVGSNMKKLVPKKFRSSKKKYAHSRFVMDGSIENDQCQYQVQEQEQEQEKQNEAQECELESKVQSLIVSAEKSDRAAEVVDDVRTSREILPKDSKAETDLICISGDSKVGEEVKRKRMGNLRYWFICLIVLAGLVGGKILALGLTLCWCLVLKAGVIPRKYMKDPLFRTSVL